MLRCHNGAAKVTKIQAPEPRVVLAQKEYIQVNTKLLLAVMMNGFLLVGSAANAQGMGPGGPGGGPGGGQGGQGPRGNAGMHKSPPPAQGGPGRNGGRNGPGGPGFDADHYDMNRHWQRGERYDGPSNSRWYVDDWRSHRGLYAPPQGYRWMQYGNQFLLTSIASGVIAGVVSGVISSGMAR
ncbi:RcnB family protein [Acetobacter lambici]|uniref:RcnB family protein n=1 Tax=Acetobacter lambici TaxID=1332824 RepID=A0ABT1EX16_9PROT|nr:RcnB family protein [Acetobacter lambici]MCP1241362.1 RcnB family protein [Acetobacter lambici]MCP1257486.1 RcnB family protein [Acetobacter lambici]